MCSEEQQPRSCISEEFTLSQEVSASIEVASTTNQLSVRLTQ